MDNISAIHTLQKLPNNQPTQIKQENWDLIYIINNLLKNKKITYTIHKTKSHSKKPNTPHNLADSLAKKGCCQPKIELNLNYLISTPYFSWYNNIISIPIRKLTKIFHTLHTLNHFLQIKKLQNNPTFNIQLFFTILNSQNYNAKLYTLRIKIILDNLPTMLNLNIRYPHLYLTPNCVQCNQPENISHIISCYKAPWQLPNILKNYINQTIENLNLTNFQPLQIQQIQQLLINTNNTSEISLQILTTISGTIDQQIFNQIHSILHKHTQIFFINLSNNLLNWFITEIWTPRNQTQHTWECARNITFKSKRTKTYFPKSTIHHTTTATFNYNIDQHIHKLLYQNFTIYSCFN
jgi:hypothetical protein